MNNQSPLIPQGSLLEQKNKGRARFKLAVFFVLAVHGIGLFALLMQGCRREGPAQQTDQSSNAAPPAIEPANVETNLQPATAVNPVPPVVPETAAPPGGGTEYTIAKGDTFSTIASHFHVSVKAITDANPGVDPTKLQIGKKIHIPPPAPTTPSATGAAPVETASGEKIYVVKSGDNLTKIALEFHTTPKAIRAANDLKTDSIKVGQKLKIPVKAPPPATAPGASPSTPAPAPGSAPAPR